MYTYGVRTNTVQATGYYTMIAIVLTCTAAAVLYKRTLRKANKVSKTTRKDTNVCAFNYKRFYVFSNGCRPLQFVNV